MDEVRHVRGHALVGLEVAQVVGEGVLDDLAHGLGRPGKQCVPEMVPAVRLVAGYCRYGRSITGK